MASTLLLLLALEPHKKTTKHLNLGSKVPSSQRFHLGGRSVRFEECHHDIAES